MSAGRSNRNYPDWLMWWFGGSFVWALVGILAVIAAWLASVPFLDVVAAVALPGVVSLFLTLYAADFYKGSA